MRLHTVWHGALTVARTEEYMQIVNNERGGVIVFVTLMVVLLMIMVGMGLDTGHLSFIRSQGQGAVDAAALSAVSGLANGGTKAEIELRATAFQTNNNYVGSPGNLLTSTNVSYVLYDSKTGAIEPSSYGLANGVRVALERKIRTVRLRLIRKSSRHYFLRRCLIYSV